MRHGGVLASSASMGQRKAGKESGKGTSTAATMTPALKVEESDRLPRLAATYKEALSAHL